MNRRWAGSPRGDDGTSLAELLVTMIIFGIVVIATASLTIGFQRSNAQNLSRQNQIDDARSAIQAMSKTLTSSVKPAQLPACASATCPEEAFIYASDFGVKFYANLNNAGNVVGPSRVEYQVVTTGPNAGQLIESIQTPDSNTPGPSGSYEYCDATIVGASATCKAHLRSQPIAFHIVAGSGAPLFQYFDQTGTAYVPPVGGSLSSAQMSHMLSVQLDVRSMAATQTSGATEYIQRVTLPNAAALIRQLQEATTP